jgi:hypothetical protein
MPAAVATVMAGAAVAIVTTGAAVAVTFAATVVIPAAGTILPATVVTTTSVRIAAPTRVPEVTGAPLREWPRLSLGHGSRS